MGSLTLIAVGFVLATALVIALARSSTARWERDRRAAVAARAADSTPRTPADGAVLGRPGAMARAGLTALRDRASRFRAVRALAPLLSRGRERGIARLRSMRRLRGVLRSSLRRDGVRPGRRTTGRSPGPSVDGDQVDGALPSAPSEAVTDVGGTGVGKAAGRRLPRRIVLRGRRRALAFLHRDEESHAAHVPREGSEESPAAR